jgi:hypothetical protein
MVVHYASYHGLPASRKFGLSDDYMCTVDVTCIVKKQCNAQHECNITVDEKLIPGEPCPGLSKYLYFEYICVEEKIPDRVRCGMYSLAVLTGRTSEFTPLLSGHFLTIYITVVK